MEIKKAVCLHEEDAGVLWKHMDYRTGAFYLQSLMCTVNTITESGCYQDDVMTT